MRPSSSPVLEELLGRLTLMRADAAQVMAEVCPEGPDRDGRDDRDGRADLAALLALAIGTLDATERLAGLGAWRLQLATHRLWWSPEVYRVFGLPPDAGPPDYASFLALVHPEDRHGLDAVYQRSIRDGVPYDFEHRLLLPDGTERWVQERGLTVRDAAGVALRSVGTVQDITARRHNDDRQRLAAAVFEKSLDAMIVCDASARILEANPAMCRTIGYTLSELRGETPRLWKSDFHDASFYHEMWVNLRATGQWRGEIWNRRKSGEAFPSLLSIVAVTDLHGVRTHYLGTLRDLTGVKQFEAKAEWLAHHDPLTGLPNRRLAVARLEHALGRAKRDGVRTAVLIAGLDGFKLVNDSFGLRVGDELLVAVAHRLREHLREADTLARIGGDEFVIVAEGLEAETEGLVLATRLQQAMSAEFVVAGVALRVEVSVGLAVAPQDGDAAGALLDRAQLAMHRAKGDGRGRVRPYAAELSVTASERLRLEVALRAGIPRGELELHYQPQVDLASGRTLGVEALVRWRHPELGLVPPVQFIPMAEATGLILPLGEWVLFEGCRQMRTWLDQGAEYAYVAVNVSGLQITRGDVVAVVARALRETGLPAAHLVLEITETSVMDGLGHEATLRGLRALGVQLSIDDFGTGHSSLSYLKRLPVQELKIDRAFVAGLPGDAHDLAIVRAIIGVAHALDLCVVAEGVETQAQADLLRGLGCQRAQGWLFGRPVPAVALASA